ncbi:rod-binding protein [Stagnihabitans tardus]|uniref:Chemotaxis protein chel n=1 Tax=Stagnihabitans tardus TaxID=2699202 RepID=A0AAE4YCC5_9RHOB|nr:rod-binding protein [Stagnihabitans tardus]NBZ87340.1 chemotaxis protein chel [Stagnihabitans tardus]
MELPPSRPQPAAQPTLPPEREKLLRQKAEELEAGFLSEMLSYTGLNATSDFAGGSGEDQFSSFLRAEQAKAMVKAGGIGLAESIFKALAERDDIPS